MITAATRERGDSFLRFSFFPQCGQVLPFASNVRPQCEHRARGRCRAASRCASCCDREATCSRSIRVSAPPEACCCLWRSPSRSYRISSADWYRLSGSFWVAFWMIAHSSSEALTGLREKRLPDGFPGPEEDTL